ncbi:gamma-glutamyl-gamma-aminobutyrate hydrolase family protein [Hwanghaeella sp.]|uniref:gamma-glutamyl-gamma-aminobutyrate hydrolase family protein n=1 Tax=Hwanghaeella sp. TaxID=2605943 RepID=UPI003CCBB563
MQSALIGVSGCAIEDEGNRFYVKVGDKYVNAIAGAAEATPMIIPPLGDVLDLDLMLDRLDGLFLTGSPSNVEPHHYEGPAFRDGVKRDARRDSTTLPLIKKAIQRGMPVFAVCRGHQELNVALGGTLHQHVQELPGKRDHRVNNDLDYMGQYDVAHSITIRPDGPLAALAGATEANVNSLHSQAIDRLAPGLLVEAESPDGVIEAVSMPSAKGFLLSVQWHPEHPVALTWTLSKAMFAAFGDAARAYAAKRYQSGAAA